MSSTAVAVAKVAAICSSGIFAGYTWALSDATLPAILQATDEASMARQWRTQYIRGFLLAIPSTIINIVSWGYLAYTAQNNLARQLLVTAAVTTGSGTVFAWTALRYINGALAMKAEKKAGHMSSISLNYSRNEYWTEWSEQNLSTEELAVKWMKYNKLRAVILIAGTAIGAYGLVLLT